LKDIKKKEEMMDGDNQYFCEDCDKKRDAKRFIKLTDLPRVLNLQLLRFVYDRNTGTKKKLSNKIK
jgi:ubiquitin carboxyl-terminal hydrolase 48